MLALIGMQEWMIALPFLAMWILALAWIVKTSKKPWWIHALVIVAALAITLAAFAFVVNRAKHAPAHAGAVEALFSPSPVVFADKQQMSVPSSSQAAFLCQLEWPARLQVDVVEVYGKNIEFRVLQDGKPVGYSGVHAGRASGAVDVDRGTVTISVVNENVLEGKSVQLSAVGSPR